VPRRPEHLDDLSREARHWRGRATPSRRSRAPAARAARQGPDHDDVTVPRLPDVAPGDVHEPFGVVPIGRDESSVAARVEDADPGGPPAGENIEDLAPLAPGISDGLEQDAIAGLRPAGVGDPPHAACLLGDEAAAGIGARRGREAPLDQAVGPPQPVTTIDPLEAPLGLQRPQKRPQRTDRVAPEAEFAQDSGRRQERATLPSEQRQDPLRRERRCPPAGRPAAPAFPRRPAPLSAPPIPADNDAPRGNPRNRAAILRHLGD
jgi:hypothetical protein